MGDHPKALKVLKAVVSYFPKDPEGWFYIGRAQLDSGDPQGAVESFKTMLSIVPKNLYGKYYLGQAYGKLGEDGEAHYNLGMYYMGRRQFKNARFHLERALEILPDDSEKRQTAERALKDLSEHPESDRS
jgi:tetratricopeptide (TPR) repeat protein